MKKTVYFTRHGETAGNVQDLVQDPNIPLSEKGIRQARLVADRFLTLSVDLVLSSDYPRAVETAEIIAAQCSVPHEQHLYFRERRGAKEVVGKPRLDPEVQRIYKEMQKHKDDAEWRYSDEENFYDLIARAKQALAFLEALPGTTIVVVTHAIFLKHILSMIWSEKVTPEEFQNFRTTFRIENTGIATCILDSEHTIHTGWQIITWNDHAHLADPVVGKDAS